MAENLQMTINKDGIENDINNIEYYLDRLNEIEINLERELNEVRENYTSNSSKIFFQKSDLLKSNFKIINSNLNSYKNDLKKLLTIVDEKDVLLSRKIESSIGNIK